MSSKIFFVIASLAIIVTKQSNAQSIYHEQYRPQIHFSPKEGWMNDPNGMIYYNNQYHLYYQHYPYSSVWGPMHWGMRPVKILFTGRNSPSLCILIAWALFFQAA